MSFPDKIVIGIKLEDSKGAKVSLSNIFVDIDFYIGGEIIYVFCFGPTNDNGILVLTKQLVKQRLQESKKYNIMDYKEPLDKVTSIRARLISGNEIQKWLEENKKTEEWKMDKKTAERLDIKDRKISTDNNLKKQYEKARNGLFMPASTNIDLDKIHDSEQSFFIKTKNEL